MVVEATGGLERVLTAALCAAGIAVAVVNPRQVRDFAKATGRLAKTDRIDAAVLARFAEAVRPEPRPLADEASRELSSLVARRRQLFSMVTAEGNRLPHAPKAMRRRIEAHRRWMRKEIGRTEAELDRVIRENLVWREKDALLRSVPEVGPAVSAVLLTELPELEYLDRRRLAALVGVAPMNRDSGTSCGLRTVLGRRSGVRTTLYKAAPVATRYNSAIKRFYERLLSNGKPKKVALTACMRKLLTILGAVLRERTPWQPSHLPTP